jgi:hypothetical protein
LVYLGRVYHPDPHRLEQLDYKTDFKAAAKVFLPSFIPMAIFAVQ